MDTHTVFEYRDGECVLYLGNGGLRLDATKVTHRVGRTGSGPLFDCVVPSGSLFG